MPQKQRRHYGTSGTNLFTTLETALVANRVQVLERMKHQGIELNTHEAYTLMLYRAELEHRDDHRKTMSHQVHMAS